MTQPEGQPTTMTVREQLEANGLKHLYDMRTLDRDSRSYGERVEDILTTLISNAKEEERRSIAKDFQESSGVCSMHQLPDRYCRICFPLSSNNPKP